MTSETRAEGSKKIENLYRAASAQASIASLFPRFKAEDWLPRRPLVWSAAFVFPSWSLAGPYFFPSGSELRAIGDDSLFQGRSKQVPGTNHKIDCLLKKQGCKTELGIYIICAVSLLAELLNEKWESLAFDLRSDHSIVIKSTPRALASVVSRVY